jgi:hypothetical protein
MRSPLPAQRFRAGRSGEAYTLRRRIVGQHGGEREAQRSPRRPAQLIADCELHP